MRVADVERLFVRSAERRPGKWEKNVTEHRGVARLRGGKEKALLHEPDPARADERVRWVIEELTRELETGRWTRQ